MFFKNILNAFFNTFDQKQLFIYIANTYIFETIYCPDNNSPDIEKKLAANTK